ncbi:adenylate/guanylate cyclase domain-containing protein [Paramylibacter kogurei]|uniref:adenylate/guanylate cyclase domain-containing protein n=1 Tax=Paramylibacter kogurei TaxID=1889778 RepID=UPI0013FE4D4C|nr:adenylate/guanylate cyclase domain-containing protein [Amylibacter kogurei]
MEKLKARFFKWFEIGTEGYDIGTRRRLIVTNVLITVIAVLSVLYAVIFFLFDPVEYIIPVLMMFSVAGLFLFTPFFHKLNPYVGSVYNLSIWLIYGMTLVYIFGSDSGIHYFFLGGATGAILIYNVSANPISIFSIIVQTSIFLSAEFFWPQSAHWLELPQIHQSILAFVNIVSVLMLQFCLVSYAFYQAHTAEALLEKEYQYSEQLLANMMPTSIAAQLKREPEKTIADGHEQATILFADIVGFTERASNQPPEKVVAFLNELFTKFDALATKHGLEKIKTLGDAFMVAGGMPSAQDDHCERVADMALEMLDIAKSMPENFGKKVQLRIGIHSGPVVAGVIGTKKPFYDVWGDTVNLAARLETNGHINRIQVTTSTKELLEHAFTFELRGQVEIKGKGKIDVWYLIGRK